MIEICYNLSAYNNINIYNANKPIKLASAVPGKLTAVFGPWISTDCKPLVTLIKLLKAIERILGFYLQAGSLFGSMYGRNTSRV
jgi:hypothetical protein